MLYKLRQPDFTHEDDRGALRQLIHEGFSQINVITSKKDTIRGGHYHKLNTEAFYILSGEGEVYFTDGSSTDTYHFETGSFFEIQANVSHSFRYLKDTVLVSMYSRGVENSDGSKDIYDGIASLEREANEMIYI